jgi:tRNA(Arg) A34 adenosine deaminase TadA
MNDRDFLTQTLEQAKESVKKGGFPAGTLIVKGDKILSRGISVGNIIHDPTSHGEINAIREACKNINSSSLEGVTIYSSLEPCMMCLAASMWAGVSKIVYACSKSKVSTEYYGGNYQSSNLNGTFMRKIEIIQIPEFENISLEIIHGWEKKLAE